MATWNGIIASTATTMAGASTTILTINPAVPQKWFKHGLFSCVLTNGVSVGIGAQVVGYIGGASFVIAGFTGGTTVGSKIFGTTGGATFGFPRPTFIVIQSVGAATGFTATFGLGGWY